jgi:hypothetical protein
VGAKENEENFQEPRSIKLDFDLSLESHEKTDGV